MYLALNSAVLNSAVLDLRRELGAIGDGRRKLCDATNETPQFGLAATTSLSGDLRVRWNGGRGWRS